MQNNAEKDDINNINDYVFKLVLVGDSGVGKSCIMHHFMYNRFKKDTTQTIGVDFSAKNINVNNQDIKLQIWDTAGQEKFRSLNKLFFKDAKIAIIVIDITQKKTFKAVDEFWYPYIREICGEHCVIGIAENKVDLFEKDELPKDSIHYKTLSLLCELKESHKNSTPKH